MTTARRDIVNVEVTRYYHCISRCVRQVSLCGAGKEHRKQWIESRIELLARAFAVSVAGFAIMDNHFHLLIRLDPEDAKAWSDEEVIRRWISVYPPRRIDFQDENSVKRWIQEYSRNPEKIKVYRERLANMGWFMKALKEPLARMINKEDKCCGTCWEGRYKSVQVKGDEAILGVCAYIDLNPVAAGAANTPESSQYTSYRQRVEHFRRKKKLTTLKSAKQGSVVASRTIGNTEQDHWLIPFEDRRPHTNSQPSSPREGMLETYTLGNYLLLVEHVGRIYREGKATIKQGVADIFDRLDSTIEYWGDRIKQMLSVKKLRGHSISITE